MLWGRVQGNRPPPGLVRLFDARARVNQSFVLLFGFWGRQPPLELALQEIQQRSRAWPFGITRVMDLAGLHVQCGFQGGHNVEQQTPRYRSVGRLAVLDPYGHPLEGSVSAA